MRFGDFIAQKRLAKQISLRKMADMVGLSAPYWSDIEKNRKNPPTLEKLELIATILGLTEDEKTDMNFINTIYGVIPTMFYAVFYVEEILRHLKDGKVDKYYDFYNFTGGKKEMVGVAAVVVTGISYLISILIWVLN